jgi:hypothetical protein
LKSDRPQASIHGFDPPLPRRAGVSPCIETKKLCIETKIDLVLPTSGLIFGPFLQARYSSVSHGEEAMTDQQLALQAVSEAQRILEEYLQPRPQNNERILDKLVEVLERPDLVVAVSRMQQRNSL